MRGLDPIPPHTRRGIRRGLRLLAIAALALTSIATSTLQADDPKASIDLAAYRVRTWEDGDERWILLDGRAAILHGTEAIRADRAVIRIRERADERLLDIYAEGGDAGRSRHFAWNASGPLRLSAYEAKPEEVPTGSDTGDRALIARGFPESAFRKDGTPKAATRTVSRPESGPETAPADPPVETKFQTPPVIVDPSESDAIVFPDVPDIDSPTDDGRGLSIEPLDGMAPLPVDESSGPIVIAPDEMGRRPMLPGTQRVVSLFLRRNAPDSQFQLLRRTADGTDIFVATGGLTLVTESYGQFGTIDVTADNAIIWTKLGNRGGNSPDGVKLTQDADDPLEIYLEGHVIFRQDERKDAGNGDSRLVLGNRFYMDIRAQRFTLLDGEFDQFAADFVAPIRFKGDRIQQFKDTIPQPDGRKTYGPAFIQIDNTMTTGSRFPYPGYRFTSRSMDLFEQTPTLMADPRTGTKPTDPDDPDAPRDSRYLIEGRQNTFFLGPVPIFYWPRFVTTSDEPDPALRRITFRANNVFGQQLLTDWNGFKLFGIRKPGVGDPTDWLPYRWIGWKRPTFSVDEWNIDVDYLSYRGVAAGSEFGYYGRDFSRDFLGYDLFPNTRESYYGFIDFWGLRDWGIDNMGPGPAILNNTPPTTQLFTRNAVPPLVDFRGRYVGRHMQSLNPINADMFDDTRFQLETAVISDRNFLEEYFKRLFDTGTDQASLFYFIRQRQNRAFTFLTEGNLQNWYTESQWLPKLDYYRLGDSLFGDALSYSQHSGVNYANTHTSIEVNNPNTFAFLPYDPVTNTSGPFSAFRAHSGHELSAPINLGFARIIPYGQGQLVGWSDQLDGQTTGRAWGAGGAKLNLSAYKVFPGVESELLNLHGLAHKGSVDLDFRTAYSSYSLGRLAIQDDLDDNTYEYVRRYFAMTQFNGALLPQQYDPRFLTLRRTISPITGTVDIQDSIQTLRMETHHRLQTKRGPKDNRRIIDYMTFDLGTTYFPNANRDNFGTPFGQTTYNFEWYLGDRTTFISTGWFEFFDVTGQTLESPLANNIVDPNGLQVINAGFQINRPPRGVVYFGYYIINTGPISTSALNGAYSYWLSPKWYGSVSMSYDFGNNILLGTTGSVTRIGADFLTSIGLTVDPQRESYSFGFEITPRLSPNLRLGSGGGMGRFDSRFAATE